MTVSSYDNIEACVYASGEFPPFYQECPSQRCIRKFVYKRHNWFWHWIIGNPKLGKNCIYYLREDT